MKKNLLKEIISDIGGKPGSEVFEIMFGESNVNEFLIAKKLDMTINQVRNILYKLSDYNLVEFIREKDKKKGWYTYFWTLDEEKALKLLDQKIERRVNRIDKRLEDREKMTYYICEDCSREVREDQALEENFTCPECGQVYDVNDDSKLKRKLKRKIKKLKKKRKQIFEVLGKVRVKLKEERKKDAKRAKERKKEEKRDKHGRMPIKEVKGIGKKKAKKFKNNRITSVEALLRLKPETVAEKIGISVRSAKKYQKRAKKLE